MSTSALRIVVLIVRVAIGAIFIVAGAAKMGHFAEFAQQIAAFRIVPQPLVAPMAVLMPFIEIVLGGCLVAGIFTRLAGWVAVGLLLVFDLAIASAVLRGLHLSCGCFGPNDATVTTWGEVARDAVFVVLALLIAVRPPGALALDRRMRNIS